jgi:cytochrome b
VTPRSPESPSTGGGIRVWDPLVRVLHWALVASVAAAWLTKEGWGRWHEWIGYMSLAVVAVRIAWGWSGSRYARFSQFVRGPRAVLRYAVCVLAGSEPRYIGHNPLGGWMIVALIVDIVLVGSSGWLYTTDAYWGVEWVEDLHEALATLLLVLIALHVAGVIAASVRHRENLAGAMVHGRKRPPESGEIA